MSWVKRLFFIVLCLVVTIYVIRGIDFLLGKIFKEADPDYISTSLGAFFGAFFVFFFVIIERMIGRILARQDRNRNALVKHQRLLNEYISIVGDLIFSIEEFTKALEANGVYTTYFPLIQLEPDLLQDFSNIDYTNDAFELNIDLRKSNQSLACVVEAYNDLKKAFLGRTILADVFHQTNHSYIVPHLKSARGFLIKMDEKIEVLFAKNKALFKSSERAIDWFLGLFTIRNSYPRGFDKKWKQELVQIKKDRELNIRRSQNELDEINQRA